MDLNSALTNDEAKSALLSSARVEMYSALQLFYDHVKHSISLMFTVMTAVFAILGFIATGREPQGLDISTALLLGGVVLILLFPLGVISIIIIGRYYRLYVAALIYAAELHESVGLDSHAWFQQIKEYKRKLGPNVSLEALVKLRTYSWPHSWLLYSILIWLISITGLGIGIFVLLGIDLTLLRIAAI